MADGGQYFGKYSGIVKDNADADKLGTVKVSVPAIFPPDELMVARAALPFGWFFVPENDTPVWVEFEGGDATLPLWTGVQAVSGKQPSDFDLDPPQKRLIHTPAGHLILFDDKSGEELVKVVEAAHKHEIVLDKNGVKVTDGANGHSIVLSSSGLKAAIKDGPSIELASGGVTVDAGSNSLTLKGSSIELKGTSVNLNASSVKLGSAAAMPVIRVGDMGTGNLGAPVPITGPGSTQVTA